ncbi:flagellar biosynthesis protein FlhA [Desulfurobacterium crinifex]
MNTQLEEQSLNWKALLPEFLIIGGVVAIVVLMVIPIPAFLVDLLIALSISFSLMLLITAMYVRNPLEFSIFPTLLLVATLFRLSLNVTTTKRILLYGDQGAEAAGKIIKTFGQFVVGGNFVVGIIIFLILVIINFVVIVKGSERVAEVAARFTLDAMPGKQMSIDADLSAGLITEEEARKRRQEVIKEADFYGAMDGASKFVKGDAIAGLIITAINIIGGIAIGVLQKHLPISEALSTYTILTVGDGLSSQIPSLLTATATGVIVTRAASETNFGRDFLTQFSKYPKTLMLVGMFLILLGLVPGFPTFIFGLLGASLITSGYKLSKKAEEEYKKTLMLEELKKKEEVEKKEESEEELIQEDILVLEIGYKLVPLVDERENGVLVKRIKNLRKNLIQELGILLPMIRIRDNLQLAPGEYVFYIKGVEEARGTIEPGSYLAIDVGGATRPLKGIPTKDPIFNLRAYWIPESMKAEAQRFGYTVVDAPTVVITHLSEIIKKKAHEIITREDTNRLLEILKKKYPKLVEDALNAAGLGTIHRVICNLLKEGIPVRDIISILETIADYAPHIKDVDQLTEQVRKSLSKVITSMLKTNGSIKVITLSPKFEEKLRNSIIQTQEGYKITISPQEVRKVVDEINRLIPRFLEENAIPVLLTSPDVRRFVANLVSRHIPTLKVIAYDELADNVKVQSVGVVGN